MIRKEALVTIKKVTSHWDPNGYWSVSAKGGYGGRLRYDQDPQRGPFWVGDMADRHVWVYKSEVYTIDEDLDAEAVEALILEAENRIKVRGARAKALMAQAQTLDQAAKQKREPIPDDVKMFVWQRDGGKCAKCGSTRNLEYDHDIPFSMGGSNTARNLRLLCETCNRSKGASLI